MIEKIIDKFSASGVWFSALSCTACFPALGGLASTLGLSFLAPFEGVAINTLLPIFASIALLSNLYGWYKNKAHIRGVLGVIGPIAVLLTLYPLWQYAWSTNLFYSAIALMLTVSLYDIFTPSRLK